MGNFKEVMKSFKEKSDDLGNKYLEHIKILEDHMITLQGNQIELFEMMKKFNKELLLKNKKQEEYLEELILHLNRLQVKFNKLEERIK
jgi:ABC-type oligopeptide transport system substrate-binding subunit